MSAFQDVVVIGAGVVGLAVARALARAGREVLVLEVEGRIAAGQSSRNSEVIHAGLYYPPASLKARSCVAGRRRLYAYAASRGIPHRRLGKLVVAGEGEEPRLEALAGNARACGVEDLELIAGDALSRREPRLRGAAALFSPSSGVIDSHRLALALQGDLEAAGGGVVLATRVERLDPEGPMVRTADLTLACRLVVNCAGLGALPLLEASGWRLPHRQYRVRGHWFALAGPPPFEHLIYPLPDADGLGIHATPDLAGRVRFGPDTQWVADEDYRFDEGRRGHFAAAIRRYWPGLDEQRLAPDQVGIRSRVGPQGLGPGTGAGDFIVEEAGDHGVEGVVNLLGIESPGLTAALALADHVVDLTVGRTGQGE